MIKHATKYPPDERSVLVRRKQESTLWRWLNPVDGSTHGTNTTQYAEFETAHEAIKTAKDHGYTVTFDLTDMELLELLNN